MRSLLFELADADSARVRQEELSRVIRADIVAHLRALCITRRGTMLPAPRYGAGDSSFIIHSSDHAIDGFVAALQQMISEFEPRLSEVTVRNVPEEDESLMLRLEVSARMQVQDRRLLVRFETTIDAASNVELR